MPTARSAQHRIPSTAARFTATLERSDNRLWGCHLEVPARVAKTFVDAGARRIVFSLNGAAPIQRALLPHGKGTFVITVNKALRTSLDVDAGASVKVAMWEDASTYGLPMPDEMRELLAIDPEGKALFDALTPGKKRTLLYIVDNVKDGDKRAARAVVILRHLKNNNGAIHGRVLTQELRDPRRSLDAQR